MSTRGVEPMDEKLTRTVVLVGMMGAGKTAVGTALARLLGVPFLDSDAEVERAARMAIPEIFARDGEAFFRLREREVIERLLAGPPAVLSLGGGAFLAAENRAVIGKRAVSVWLDADTDLLWSRVRRKDTRPLLRTADPRATLEALDAARRPVYAMADLRVRSEAGLSIDAMARKVLAALRRRPGLVVPSLPAAATGRAGDGAASPPAPTATGPTATEPAPTEPAPTEPAATEPAPGGAERSPRD